MICVLIFISKLVVIIVRKLGVMWVLVLFISIVRMLGIIKRFVINVRCLLVCDFVLLLMILLMMFDVFMI